MKYYFKETTSGVGYLKLVIYKEHWDFELLRDNLRLNRDKLLGVCCGSTTLENHKKEMSRDGLMQLLGGEMQTREAILVFAFPSHFPVSHREK